MVGLSLGAILAIKLFHKENSKVVKRYILVETCFLLLAGLSFFVVYNFQDQLITFLTPQSFIKDGLVTISLLLPASLAMGMSLPILIDLDKNRHKHEKIYAINTIGGALGVVFFGFILLKYIGYLNMMYVVPLLSVFNIIFAIFILKKYNVKKHVVEIKIPDFKIKKSTALILSGLSGFIVFMLEVLWFRHLEILIGDRAYISSIILFIIIITLGISAYLSGYALKRFNIHKLYGITITATIFCFLVSQFFIPEVFYLKKIIQTNDLLKIPFVLLSFLLPIFLLGFTFPALLKLIQKNYSDKVTAISLGINSLFSMTGTLFGSYVIIKYLGVNSIFLIASMLLLIVLILIEYEYKTKYLFTAISTFLLVAFVLKGIQKLHVAPPHMILYEKQSALTHFTLVNNNSYEMYSGNYRIIFTYGKKNVAYAQEALAFAPALYIEKPKSMLNLGLGYGITVGSFLKLNPDFIDSVEIIPSVADMSFMFKDSNNNQFAHPKVNTIIDDGRRFLARTDKKYDIITANISSPYSVGGSFFLTKQYYEKVKEKLTDDGVYSQLIWGMNNPEIFNTLNSVFPYVSAIPGYDLNEIVILASSKPLELKKDINTYDQHWSFFNNQPREISFTLGEQIAKQALNTEPRFIISDDRADMLFQKNKAMGILWTYK